MTIKTVGADMLRTMVHEAIGIDTIKIEARQSSELAKLQIRLKEGRGMSLTKEEERFWLTSGKTIPITIEVVDNAVNIIDRLVKENKSLTGAFIEEQRFGNAKVKEVLSQLNALIKAGEPIVATLDGNEHMNDEDIFYHYGSDSEKEATFGELRKLAEAVKAAKGGEVNKRPISILVGKIQELEAQLTTALAERDRLKEALQDLMDVQNGPPLIRWEKEWNEAVKKARQALSSSPAPQPVTRGELVEELMGGSIFGPSTPREFIADHLLTHFDIRRKG